MISAAFFVWLRKMACTERRMRVYEQCGMQQHAYMEANEWYTNVARLTVTAEARTDIGTRIMNAIPSGANLNRANDFRIYV